MRIREFLSYRKRIGYNGMIGSSPTLYEKTGRIVAHGKLEGAKRK
jgi:hypothetical protein